MSSRLIIYGFITVFLFASFGSCNFDERTNVDDPKSSDYVKPPVGTFVINNDAEATNTTNVTLTMSMSNAIEMHFGNTMNELSSADWIPYSKEKEWTIEGGANEKKTVYAEFRDALGDVVLASDTIVYDTIPPVIYEVDPYNGETWVGLWVNIVAAYFSEEIDESTLDGNFTLSDGITSVDGSVVLWHYYYGDVIDLVAYFRPVHELDNNTTYTATITTGVKDLAGNGLAADYVWSFTTEDLGTLGAPSFDPPAGQYSTPQLVTILSGSGTSVKYTTDGSDPKTSASAIDGSSVYVNDTMTIRTYAYEAGYHDSPEGSAFYLLYPPTVTSITPTGGDSPGSVSITNLTGTGFKSGIQVKLIKSGQYDITASNVTVVNDTTLTCDFNLAGICPGAWDVAVINTDSGTGTLSGGFTITSLYGNHQAYLKAPNSSLYDNFGHSVAVDGDTAVVGVSSEDSNTTNIINGSDLSSTNDSGSENGAVYVFVRTGTTWSLQAYLKAPNTSDSDAFGSSVAISGDTVIVGAPGEDSNTTAIINSPDLSSANDSGGNIGAAYVFTRSGTAWSLQSYLKVPYSTFGDSFGRSVAIDGDTAVVGAPGEDSNTKAIINGSDLSSTNNSGSDIGAIYVFTRSGTAWSLQAYLKVPKITESFGSTLALSGDTIVVGEPNEMSDTTDIINGSDLSSTNYHGYENGAAYVFFRSGTTWTHQAYLKAPNTSEFDYFGNSVAISGNTIVIGARGEDGSTNSIINGSDLSSANDNGDLNGAAYIFVRSSSNWSLQAYLKAPNTSERDTFGGSVAISGDTVVVGATGETSTTTFIIYGSDLSATNDNGGYSSIGAVYVFTRSGADWSHLEYLKGPNISFDDSFGSPIAVSGDTVIVGATGEDSNTTAIINGSDLSSTNDGRLDSGAVYVFTLP